MYVEWLNGRMSQEHVLPYRSSATLEFDSKSNQRLEQMSCHHQSTQNHNAPCTCKWMFHFSRLYVILCTIVLCLMVAGGTNQTKTNPNEAKCRKKENFCKGKKRTSTVIYLHMQSCCKMNHINSICFQDSKKNYNKVFVDNET